MGKVCVWPPILEASPKTFELPLQAGLNAFGLERLRSAPTYCSPETGQDPLAAAEPVPGGRIQKSIQARTVASRTVASLVGAPQQFAAPAQQSRIGRRRRPKRQLRRGRYPSSQSPHREEIALD
jgi:hypothetical protein